MKWLKDWKLFESKSELYDFVDSISLDLKEDGFSIRNSSVSDFIQHKWKVTRGRDEFLKKKQESNLLTSSEMLVFEVLSEQTHTRSSSFSSGFNLYDVEPHIKRLIDFSKELGYNYFEFRKIIQYSRRSIPVTRQFLGKGRLLDSAMREIHNLQILIGKVDSEGYNESDNFDEVKTVKEILLELNDIGLQTKVRHLQSNKWISTNKFLTSSINVTIYKYDLLNSEFGDGGYIRYQISDVIDTIFRLNSYLTDLKYKPSHIYVVFQGRNYEYTLDELGDDLHSEVNYISLDFDK